MKEKQFGPIRFIAGKNRGRYPYCHSIYVEGDKVLIDPGAGRRRLAELRDGPGVDQLWLSHWHEDHIKNLDLFEDRPLLVSSQDAVPLSDIELFLDAYGIEGGLRDVWKAVMTEQFNFRPRTPKSHLKDKEIITLKTVTVEVIHTPGHTPGHLSFFFREPGVLYLGDYDLTDFGPWYGDAGSDMDQTIASVQRLRDIPAKTWITAHETGLFESDPGNLWDRYLDVIDRREEKLLERLKTPQRLEDIAKAWIVYGKPREPEAFYAFGEVAHMKKHLKRLMELGEVGMENGIYFRI